MPFEDQLQAFVNTLDEGASGRLLRGLLFLILLAAVFGSYAWSQFAGLKEPEAMECAQLARNLARGRGYTTQCIRPADLDFLTRNAPSRQTLARWPELRLPPLHPAVLAAGFKLVPCSFAPPRSSAPYDPEKKVIVLLGALWFAATALLVLRMGCLWFDRRVGLLAVLAFALADLALAAGISGTTRAPAMCLAAAAAYAAGLAVRWRESAQRPWPWLGALAAAGLLSGLAFLTRYALAPLAPALTLFAAWRAPRWRAAAAAVVLLLALAVAAPWIARNLRVSGAPFGAAPRAMLNETPAFPGQSFDRSLQPAAHPAFVLRALRFKLRQGLLHLPASLPAAGLLMVFFAASCFTRWERQDVNAFRGCLLLMLALLGAAGSLWGRGAADGIVLLLPILTVFGAAFLCRILDNAEFQDAATPPLLMAAFLVLNALPAALRTIGPRAPLPYPPYFPPYAACAARLLEPDEVLCTDIPWATAWYGDRTSLLLPPSVEDLPALRAAGRRIAAVYLALPAEPFAASGATAALDSSWLALRQGQTPPGFPFTQGFYLPPGSRDQFFVADRLRWKPRADSPLAEDGQDGLRIAPAAD